MIDAGENFSDGRAVRNHATGAHHFGKVTLVYKWTSKKVRKLGDDDIDME